MTRAVPGRIAVIGAGAAGLACAFELVRRGARVCVFEAGKAGRGALAASGGMLAAGFETAFEARDPARFAPLAIRARDLWHDWASQIEQATGRSVSHERSGSITPAFSRDELKRLDEAEARARAAGLEVRRLDVVSAQRAEPGLADCLGALEFPRDGGIDNRALGPALAAVCRAGGARVREDCGVVRIDAGPDGVALSLNEGRTEGFDAAVLATGTALPAGLEALAGLMRPVKGQMIAFDLPREAAPRRILRGLSVYLAAKPGGRLIAGATSEPGTSSLLTDADAIARIAQAARAAWPALDGAPIVEAWAGLRPMTPDELPALGECAIPGVHLALGGYRNGVLFAPAMGLAVAESVMTGTLPDWAAPLSVRRFEQDG